MLKRRGHVAAVEVAQSLTPGHVRSDVKADLPIVRQLAYCEDDANSMHRSMSWVLLTAQAFGLCPVRGITGHRAEDVRFLLLFVLLLLLLLLLLLILLLLLLLLMIIIIIIIIIIPQSQPQKPRGHHNYYKHHHYQQHITIISTTATNETTTSTTSANDTHKTITTFIKANTKTIITTQ